MSRNEREELDVYVIPPNFIEGGKLFGGMFKMRNAIEAGILAGGCALLVFKLPLSLTGKIIVLCLTSLPLAIFGLLGVDGESLSQYAVSVFKFLKNRRRLYRSDIDDFESCLFHAEKFLRNKQLDNQTKERLYRRLISMGFGWETVKRVLNKLNALIED